HTVSKLLVYAVFIPITSPSAPRLPLRVQSYTLIVMNERPLMTASEIHAFGVEIVTKQLEKDEWTIEYADGLADIHSEPQIAANKDGEQAFFVVRTAVYPARGRFDEGKEAFEKLVRHAKAHGASCYFASVGIANSEGSTE